MASTQKTGGDYKLQRVQELIDSLAVDLEEHNLQDQDRLSKLQELKVFGREAAHSDPIFTREGVATLSRHGLDGTPSGSSREALRCLVNALFLVPKTRRIFVDLGYAEKAAKLHKSDSLDDEFLIGRILFLVTYESNIDLTHLLNESGLAESINEAIARHSSKFTTSSKAAAPTALEEMALSETLKLLFNLTHFVPAKADNFLSSVPELFNILSSRPLLDPPLQPPINSLVNALLNIDIAGSEVTESLFPTLDSCRNVNRLLEILDLSLKEEYLAVGASGVIDEFAPPLISLLRKVYEAAPESVKKRMQLRLLPKAEERDKPLGKGSSLSARVLKLTTSVLALNTRELTSTLLFELSNNDASEFIYNVGYGIASGYLVSHQIPIPQESLQAAAGEDGIPINPITGQTIETENQEYKDLPEMTEEEKMREAEKLFVLFERLKKTGIVDVKNPVEEAIKGGRFEELD